MASKDRFYADMNRKAKRELKKGDTDAALRTLNRLIQESGDTSETVDRLRTHWVAYIPKKK